MRVERKNFPTAPLLLLKIFSQPKSPMRGEYDLRKVFARKQHKNSEEIK